MASRYEKLLEALVNGETTDIIPQSRNEQILKNCIEQCGVDGLCKPQSREEAYLTALAQKMKDHAPAGTPITVTSAADMDAILANATDDQVGTLYLYEGETTEAYEKGAIYIIKEA